MSELSVFRMTLGPDTVVATSEDDAWQVWSTSNGEKREDYDQWDSWEKLAADHVLCIWKDADSIPLNACGCEAALREHEGQLQLLRSMIDKLPPVARSLSGGLPEHPRCFPNGHLVTCQVAADRRTCAEWVAVNGRGFLCSSEA